MISGSKRYANEILDDVECYKAVLDGRLKIFPKGFWTKPWSLQSAAVITRYLLEEKFKYTEDDIKTKVKLTTFTDNKLTSLSMIFNQSTFRIIDNAYPNKFKPWELVGVPKGFWTDDNKIAVVKWLVEEKLGGSRERVCREFNTDLLLKYRLSILKRDGLYTLLNMAYTNEFKPWELGTVTTRFWEDKNNIKQAVKWLVETKLDNNRERVCKEFNQEFLYKHKISSIIKYGPYNILNLAYPNEFKPWELNAVTPGFWDDKNNIKEAVRWVVETKLGNDKSRLRKEFNREFLNKHGLSSLSKMGIEYILNIAYPNQFKPWEINQVPAGFWDDRNNVIEAIRWVVETKLDNNKERVLNEFTHTLLSEFKLSYLSSIGTYKLIDMAYPNEFKPTDFKYNKVMKY